MTGMGSSSQVRRWRSIRRAGRHAGLALGLAALADAAGQLERRDLGFVQAGGQFPIDGGKGDPAGFAVGHVTRTGVPWPGVDAALTFAGVLLDGRLYFPDRPAPQWEPVLKLRGAGYIDGVLPYQDGDDLDDLSLYGHSLGAGTGARHYFGNFARIGLYSELLYDYRYRLFEEKGEPPPGYLVPPDGGEHLVTLRAGAGGQRPSLNRPVGSELQASASAGFRDRWSDWGPADLRQGDDDLFLRLSAEADSVIGLGGDTGRQLGLGLSGGWVDDADWLSAFVLGGAMGRVPFGKLHGYYNRELLAEWFALANADLIQPLGRSLSGHLYADLALCDLVNPGTGDGARWEGGLGIGLGFAGPWRGEWLLTYGYAAAAERDGERGGHEVALQALFPF